MRVTRVRFFSPACAKIAARPPWDMEPETPCFTMIGCGCKRPSLAIAVCSTLGGQERCLDTSSDDPYFVDAHGKRWSVVELTTDDALAFREPGVVDTTLTLTVTDGAATTTFPVKIRACNTETLRFLPC